MVGRSTQDEKSQRFRSPRPFVLASLVAALCLVVAPLRVAFTMSKSRPQHLTASSRLSQSAIVRQATLEKVRTTSMWRLNVGHAIDVLRNDIQALFDDSSSRQPDFTIFSEDITFVDARLPEFPLEGLKTYKQVLSTLRWSVITACERSTVEITNLSPPVNNEVYIRWRLHLTPRDVLASAKGLLAPLGSANPFLSASVIGMPFIVEGYSRYEFHPWTAEIIKHTIDITNPPMRIMDLLNQYTQAPVWMNPAMQGVGVGAPNMYSEPVTPMVQRSVGQHVLASSTALHKTTPFVGASLPELHSSRPQVARSSGSWLPFLPQGCEDDFECNDGKANFPLQCCELPILGKFCCEPDDFEPTMWEPAYVPLPVPVERSPWE